MYIWIRNLTAGKKEDLRMGLIKAAMGAAGGVMADQWKEYFYFEALPRCQQL